MEGQRQFVGSYRRTIPRDGVCGVRPIPPSLQGVRYHQPVTTATKLVCGAGSASGEQWKVQVRYDHICNLPHISHIICSCCSRLTCSEFLIVANGATYFSYMPELIYDREHGCQAICRKTKRIPGKVGMRQLTQNKW